MNNEFDRNDQTGSNVTTAAARRAGMSRGKKMGITAIAALATAGVMVTGVNNLASAADNSGKSSTSASATAGASDSRPKGGPGHAPEDHTDVTGAEATKVTDAVKAKFSGVTLDSVRKDPDGSYDVLGTKDGSAVMYDVSTDLATITELADGPGGPGGAGGRGMAPHEHTAVTGSATTKVIAAVKAKDKAIKVTSVEADPDGSYDVHGTKAGAEVMVNVSKDLKTIDVMQRPAR